MEGGGKSSGPEKCTEKAECAEEPGESTGSWQGKDIQYIAVRLD